MSAVRIVYVAGSKVVSVTDKATGLVELVEISATEERAEIDTVVQEEPDVSGRYLYTP
jgi:hypothetical protein